MHSTTPTFRHALNHIAGRTRALANLPARPLAVTIAALAGAWLLAALHTPSERLALASLLTILTVAAVARARRRPRLRVVYCGERLSVNEQAIQPHMEVPGNGGPCGYDNFGGPTAAALFAGAVTHGAVKVPTQLRVECFANDTDGCDVMLTATCSGSRARVSTGWIDSARFGVDYSDEANEPQAVASALRGDRPAAGASSTPRRICRRRDRIWTTRLTRFMVGEINRALHHAK